MEIKHTKIICISGHAGSGKDAVAKILRRNLQADGHSKVVITHYADLLKYICKAFFGWNGEKDVQGRTLLQYVGTNIVREKRPDYWVNFVADMIEFFGEEWDYVIIPDARFPNEIDRLKEKGLDVFYIRITRPEYLSSLTDEQQKHISETALDDVKPDYLLENVGDLKELGRKISTLTTEALDAEQ